MKNMGAIISSHNKHILQPSQENFGCSCRNKTDCPLNNKCLTPNIVYEAQITNNTNDDQKRYLGASETPFKERFNNHKRVILIYIGCRTKANYFLNTYIEVTH